MKMNLGTLMFAVWLLLVSSTMTQSKIFDVRNYGATLNGDIKQVRHIGLT